MKDWVSQMNIPEWLQTLVWVIGVVIIIRFAFIFLIRGIQKSKQDKDSKYKTKKILDAASYVVILLALLIAYSKNLAGLSVALGVAGAGIAFALQEVIASVAGWLALMFGNFYRTGDRVQLGGIKGDVIDIG
ncbi:MAG: mechanosensitive ion channel domain-containing protein, partial [Cyclobacteriaceae bacterium]